jgi:hypothetical protein
VQRQRSPLCQSHKRKGVAGCVPLAGRQTMSDFRHGFIAQGLGLVKRRTLAHACNPVRAQPSALQLFRPTWGRRWLHQASSDDIRGRRCRRSQHRLSPYPRPSRNYETRQKRGDNAIRFKSRSGWNVNQKSGAKLFLDCIVRGSTSLLATLPCAIMEHALNSNSRRLCLSSVLTINTTNQEV